MRVRVAGAGRVEADGIGGGVTMDARKTVDDIYNDMNIRTVRESIHFIDAVLEILIENSETMQAQIAELRLILRDMREAK